MRSPNFQFLLGDNPLLVRCGEQEFKTHGCQPVGFVFLFVNLLLAFSVAAADSRLGESCDLKVFDISTKEEFLQFDRELKDALTRKDAAALSLLTSSSLLVNGQEGQLSYVGPKALQKNLDKIFTPKVSMAVLEERPNEIFCKYTGIMYGNGDVWVEPYKIGKRHRYRVSGVNILQEKSVAPPQKFNLLFSCNTESQRFVVEKSSSDGIQLRGWTFHQSLSVKPQIHLTRGQELYEGTSPCGHHIWKFKAKSRTYELSTLGCTAGPPPTDITGELLIEEKKEQIEKSWCW